MPWNSDDARRHNKKADSPVKQKVWAKVSNAGLKRGLTEGAAIREANAAVDRIGSSTKKKPSG